MLLTIVLTTVIAPLLLGIVIATLGMASPARRQLTMALLVPLAALVVHLLLEGMPAIPPVSAKHKLPLIVLMAAFCFAGLAFFRLRLSPLIATAIVSFGLGGSAWWLGKTVMGSNPEKLWLVVAVVVVAAATIPACISAEADDSRREAPALAPALFAVSLAAALNAAFGAFIGMAQINGALAALTGGWLLVGYIRFIRGDDEALVVRGTAGIAYCFTVCVHLIMTVLFTPKTSIVALLFAILPLAVAAFLVFRSVRLDRIVRPLRPVMTGLFVAVPAVVSIAFAASLFEG